jgi:hypothetical protein
MGAGVGCGERPRACCEGGRRAGVAARTMARETESVDDAALRARRGRGQVVWARACSVCRVVLETGRGLSGGRLRDARLLYCGKMTNAERRPHPRNSGVKQATKPPPGECAGQARIDCVSSGDFVDFVERAPRSCYSLPPSPLLLVLASPRCHHLQQR